MKTPQYCLRTRLLLTLIFVVATALAACGDNSKLVSDSNNTPSNNKNNKKDAGGDPDAGNGDTISDSDADGLPDAGDDADVSPPDPCLQTTPDEAAAFAEEYAQTLCERVMACGDNPRLALYVTVRDWTSVENCKADVLGGSISAGQARAGAENGTLTLNSCEVESCLPLLASAQCNGLDRLLDENFVEDFAACYGAWEGEIAKDAPCSIDAQCAGHQICDRDDDPTSCTGICVDAGLAGDGQCGESVCGFNQYCTGDNDICMERPHTGESCDAIKVCRNNATCQAGTCVEIESGLNEGDTCNFSTKLCNFDLICDAGTCASAGGEGADCTPLGGCQNAFYCGADSKCTALGGPDAPCNEGGECRSNRCIDGSCTDVESLCL